MSHTEGTRWAWAAIDLDAVRHNVTELRRSADPAQVWAVVKANGYGHGAVPVARAAIEAGASGLCVALVEEGIELRRAGLRCPILVLSEQPADQLAEAVAHDLQLTVYSTAAVEAIEAAGAVAHPVHLKVDTGMRRVGAAAAEAADLARRIATSPAVTLAALCTHLAVADDPDHPATALQLDVFDAIVDALRADGHHPAMIHAANSAGALAHGRARYDAVRCGIAMYGIAPGPQLAGAAGTLRPALSLRARISWVKRVEPGQAVSYGWRHTFEHAANVATVPLGYADGVPRRLFECGGEVLIGGRRRPIVGVVTMDQLMVDCGDDAVAIGDEVVLIGCQGDAHVTATEWADRLGTIGYEITCAISARIPRRYAGSP